MKFVEIEINNIKRAGSFVERNIEGSHININPERINYWAKSKYEGYVLFLEDDIITLSEVEFKKLGLK